MSKPFVSSREDGRSDRQVVYELSLDMEPGATLGYPEILAALAEHLPDVEADVPRERAHRAVAAANKTLLRERKRYLSVVRGVGYRMIQAEEHLGVALTKKDRAQSYLQKGISLLRNARLDELTEAQRTLHEGQLMIIGGLYQAVEASERRHAQQDRAISEMREQQAEIAERLARVEAGEKPEEPPEVS